MKSTLTQVVILLAVAGAIGGVFALTRPPKLTAPPAQPQTTPAKVDQTKSGSGVPSANTPKAGAPDPKAPAKIDTPAKAPEPQAQPPAPAKAEPKPASQPEPKTVTTPATPSTSPPAAQPEAPKPAALSEVEQKGGFKFVDLAWAKKIHDAQSLDGQGVIFIDARIFKDFTDGHIPGAMHIDKRYFDGAAPKKIRDYLPGNAVVVYCGGADCTDSEAVVLRLKTLNIGIGPYYIVKDGFPGWKKAGYPIATGGEVGFVN